MSGVDPAAAAKRVPPPETPDELYEHAPCGYLATRADGVIVRVNATLLALLSETRTTLPGRRIESLLTAAGRAYFTDHCAPLLAQHGRLSEISVDLVCATGDILPALMNWRASTDDQGELLGYRIMVVSAVERIAYERQLLAERERARQQEAMVRELNADLEMRVQARTAELVQLQKMESLGQLTGGVAHDFNNLLTPILLTLDLLQRRYLSDERALRMTASAMSAAERARVLINRLLAFARRQHLHAQAVDLSRMTDGMADLIRQSVGSGILVRTRMMAELPPARVDQNQLEMALLNLCVNARDAMPDGGELTISGDEVMLAADEGLPPGRYVRLSVSDTGSGMEPETLRRAAEPFYSTKMVGKGTGLGLSMVHGLAAQTGGRLVLESTPGHGTRATIWLPVDASAAPAPALGRPAMQGPPKRGLSILLVDDDELVRFATAEMLTELGHAVAQAQSGAEALTVLGQHAAFDVMITDYMMPGMTGVELARVARISQHSLPVLLITGFADIKAVDSGGLPRLAKPFNNGNLSAAIAETLAGARVLA